MFSTHRGVRTAAQLGIVCLVCLVSTHAAEAQTTPAKPAKPTESLPKTSNPGISGPLRMAPTKESCDAFRNVLRSEEKDLARTYWSGVGDNSAPRDAVRQAKMANAWSTITVNLTLMSAAGCGLPTAPIDETTYTTNALECLTAELKTDKDAEKNACDRSAWTPMKGREW
jgi:hypothetical protein